MPQFDNRISVMDIVAIVATAVTALSVYFGMGASVGLNTQEIRHLKTEVSRIEVAMEKDKSEIIEILKDQKQDLKDARTEAKEADLNINKKLDKIIERELANGG